MQVSLIIDETRYPYKMTTDEIKQALLHARTLMAMNPPMAISLPLTTFAGELIKELGSREKVEDGERQLTEFSRKELRDALAHAKAIRALRPRYGIQVSIAGYILAVMTELENRSQGKGNREARIARGLSDG